MIENLPPSSRGGALEALLFTYGEPVAFPVIGKLLKLTEEEVQTLVGDLRRELDREERGLMLVIHEGTVQFATKPAFRDILEACMKEEFREELTPASLETLSIIAYAGPVSRSVIDYIRGVNSSFTLRMLSLRGLVERFPDPARPHSYQYVVSAETLKHLGVAEVHGLPDYAKFRDIVSRMETGGGAHAAPTP